MDDVNATSKIDRANLLVMLVLGLISMITLSWNVTVGLVVGCAVMAFDFFLLRKLLGRMLSAESKSVMISASLLIVKFLGFFVLVALCLFYIPMNVFAFGMGATAIALTAVIVAATIQTIPKEE